VNIEETIRALENKGVAIALDIGEHSRCGIDTNCPVAIQLRKLVIESGLSFVQIMEGYTETTAEPLVNFNLDTSKVSGKTEVVIMGKKLEIDVTDMVNQSVKEALASKLTQIERETGRLASYGNSLHDTYVLEIERQRTSKSLRQFRASIEDLVKYEVMITEEEGGYVFLFKEHYNPETYVDGGVRYAINPVHAKRIARDCYLKILTNAEGNIVSTSLLDSSGGKLRHYHGSDRRDCWGNVNLSATKGKDFNLASMNKVRRMAMGAVQTINMNSLLNHTPTDMPTAEEVREKGIKLGKEGDMGATPATPVQTAGWRAEAMATTTAPRWGARRDD